MTHEADDWQTLRARLDRFARSLEMALDALPSADRASTPQIPGEPEFETSTNEEEAEILAFGWGRERFALETRWVRCVIDDPSVLPVPGLPREHGVIFLESMPLPVFDLGAILGLGHPPSTPRAVMVLGRKEAEIGLVAAQTPVWSRSERLQPIPWNVGELNSRLVRGVTRGGDLVLDGAAVLQDERLFLSAPGREPAARPPVPSLR